MSLRDIILTAPDLKMEAHEVPEWVDTEGKPITIHLRVMTGVERGEWAGHTFDSDGNAVSRGVRARLLVYCMCDDTGTPVFTVADVDALDAKNADVLNRLFLRAKKLNGLNPEDVDAAEKNSQGGGTATSK